MAKLETNHILIGLGGTGGKILQAFKKRMFEEFPNKEEREKQPVALLYIDSTREMMGLGRPENDVMGVDAGFSESEFLNIKGCDVSDLLDNIDTHPELRGLVDDVSSVRTAIGNLGEAAGQKRRAGRLLFAVNAGAYVKTLQDCFAKCYSISNKNSKSIHIFAGLCGGTGSGSIIDAIVQARNIQGWEDATINVYAMIPEQNLPNSKMDQDGRYYVNGYAALKELNALQCGRFTPCDVLSTGAPLNVFSERIRGVANGIALYSNVNSKGRMVNSFTELPKLVADYIFSLVFLVNPKAKEAEQFIRAFNYENMDGKEFENDESTSPDEKQEGHELVKVRTKKLYSFGLKRVIYPERRVLQHMTYTVGQKVLYQFRYNHWVPNMGFIDEPEHFDYRAQYLTDENLSRWMLDEDHLTLEEEILTTKDGPTFGRFGNDWKDRIDDWAGDCSDYEFPLAELSSKMSGMFDEHFRDEGVRNYYNTKKRSLDQIASKVRDNIEKELFNKWRDGDISIMELDNIGKLLAAYVSDDLKKKIDASYISVKEKLVESEDNLDKIKTAWNNVGFFGKFVMKQKSGLYSGYQEELAYALEYRTRLIGLEFARELTSNIQREIGRLSDDISSFSKMLSDCIDETNRLIAAQQKVNPDIDDMSGSVIEVSEEERMFKYEEDICFDKESMYNMARQLREAILPPTDFKNFGDLLNKINEKVVKKAFDVRLSEIIKTKHSELPSSATKVLGLNILTQLQQKLGHNQLKIQEFAKDILEQSCAFINLDRNQIIANIRNNDRPVEFKNINMSEVLVSIPSPDDNSELKEFAEDLKMAFEDQAGNGMEKPKIFMGSSRKNELSILMINYAFPMRAITWLAGYKKLYERFLNTGNVNLDLNHSILAHSEGECINLPDIFAKSDAELRKIDEERAAAKVAPTPAMQPQTMTAPNAMASPAMPGSPVPPPMPGAPVPPPMQPAEPQVQMYMNIGGQNYGPYDYATLKGFVPTGQLSAQTMVWQQGMASWMQAGQVPELQALFAPTPPPAVPGMPPMPPTPGSVPPPMV